MRKIDPSHVKETSFTCSLVIHWIQKRCLWQFIYFFHYSHKNIHFQKTPVPQYSISAPPRSKTKFCCHCRVWTPSHGEVCLVFIHEQSTSWPEFSTLRMNYDDQARLDTNSVKSEPYVGNLCKHLLISSGFTLHICTCYSGHEFHMYSGNVSYLAASSSISTHHF